MGGDRVDEGVMRDALAAAGYVADSAPLRPEFRRWRWVAPLRGDRIAFFADAPEAVERLGRERAILDLIGPRIIQFAIPSVEHASPDGRLQVRSMVKGVEATACFGGYECQRLLDASPAGRRLARELGHALAELHGSVTHAEAEAVGVPVGEPLPQAIADLHRRLVGCLPDPALAPALDAVLERCVALGEEEAGRVLIHGDPCAANLVIDPESGRLVGMFDFEYAAWADRHDDFYALHSFGDVFTERALAAYAAASGVRPSLRRAAAYHVYAAFYALAEALTAGDPGKVAKQLGWVHGALAGSPGRLLGLPAPGAKTRPSG